MARRRPWRGDYVLHVMNRAARRQRLFDSDEDYQLFVMSLVHGLKEVPVRLFAYVIMPNHFHLVVWPRTPGQLSEFMQLVTGIHGQRWNQRRGTVGMGAVYQGRYKAVPVQQETHFLTVCRYVERNPLRAGLVKRAEDWPWSSLHQRCKSCNAVPLDTWPIPPSSDWLEYVNRPEPSQEIEVVRSATEEGRPIGTDQWRRIEARERRPGRPRGSGKKGSDRFLRGT